MNEENRTPETVTDGTTPAKNPQSEPTAASTPTQPNAQAQAAEAKPAAKKSQPSTSDIILSCLYIGMVMLMLMLACMEGLSTLQTVGFIIIGAAMLLAEIGSMFLSLVRSEYAPAEPEVETETNGKKKMSPASKFLLAACITMVVFGVGFQVVDAVIPPASTVYYTTFHWEVVDRNNRTIQNGNGNRIWTYDESINVRNASTMMDMMREDAQWYISQYLGIDTQWVKIGGLSFSEIPC